MKAVILARGVGRRMRQAHAASALTDAQSQAADTGIKGMIPLRRPFLDYVLSGLADAGVGEVCLVIAPGPNPIRQHYRGQQLRRLALTYAEQAEPLGTADALAAAERFIGSDQFLCLNSDNYYPVDVLRRLTALGAPGVVLFKAGALVRSSNIPAERLRQFAFCEIRGGYLSALREKPGGTRVPSETPVSSPDTLISMNLWRLSPEILPYCRTVARSGRGEYELPQAIQQAVSAGMRMRAEVSELGVLDLSMRADIAEVARALDSVEVEL
ncbi:MAG: NTP transferase domain-containing protein [Acidobacteria bacterium]|nr:NTP transferase domain-containing protein [Acidobacteriota bacterium]